MSKELKRRLFALTMGGMATLAFFGALRLSGSDVRWDFPGGLVDAHGALADLGLSLALGAIIGIGAYIYARFKKL
jgi:hypothetical protein